MFSPDKRKNAALLILAMIYAPYKAFAQYNTLVQAWYILWAIPLYCGYLEIRPFVLQL